MKDPLKASQNISPLISGAAKAQGKPTTKNIVYSQYLSFLVSGILRSFSLSHMIMEAMHTVFRAKLDARKATFMNAAWYSLKCINAEDTISIAKHDGMVMVENLGKVRRGIF